MKPTLGTESMENKLACQHVLCIDNLNTLLKGYFNIQRFCKDFHSWVL